MSSYVYLTEIAYQLAFNRRTPDPNTDTRAYNLFVSNAAAAVTLCTGDNPQPAVTTEDAGDGATIRQNLESAAARIRANPPTPVVGDPDPIERQRLNAIRISAHNNVAAALSQLISAVQPDGLLDPAYVELLDAQTPPITWSTR